MLEKIGVEKLADLFSHLPQSIRKQGLNLPQAMTYENIAKRLEEIAEKNKDLVSFLGDGLKNFKVPAAVEKLLEMRELTTSYTPYQPERSQGTLITHWIYQCCVAAITGFEAVNASFYDRATALFEALKCSQRITKKKKVAVAATLFPGDIEVVDTLRRETELEVISIEPDWVSGKIAPGDLETWLKEHKESCGAIAFPQVNHFGNLEEFDELTSLAHAHGLKVVAVIEPMLLGVLKPPSQWGEKGADLFVAEGQALSLPANFGGPGLGMFGVRYDGKDQGPLRKTAGRFIGKAKDISGRDCFSIILSTREQHIRKEKANSNICSNQAYLATMAGASLLAQGGKGMKAACQTSRALAERALKKVLSLPGVHLAYPNAAFYNEVTLALDVDIKGLLKKGSDVQVAMGVDISTRNQKKTGSFLLANFTNLHSQADVDKWVGVFEAYLGEKTSEREAVIPAFPTRYLRTQDIDLSQYGEKELLDYYRRLAAQNVSPDRACYPLGSCTMKYNPYLNDHTAGLKGFQRVHPQMAEEDVQGALEILYHNQRWFKEITGLPGITTQPVAGAQGELVGLKLFQAYFRERNEKRDVILIPRTAHGTNAASASMAGLLSRRGPEGVSGIILLEAGLDGEIDMPSIDEILATYGRRIMGAMVTNPNTSGIFERQFKQLADKIHALGGFIYMDGANMNAIAGWVDLGKLGVDAVHNNTHKTWSIPHGGGGPGDAFVAVSQPLIPFLPGRQVVKTASGYRWARAEKSIGSFHRHHGHFAHKVRAYTYLLALGKDGIKKMSATAVASARYLLTRLARHFPTLPANTDNPRMHEFIITLREETFKKIEAAGVSRQLVIARVGKLFLDFGFHAPTVAFPETYGLMIEPTESYTKKELERFADAVIALGELIETHPQVLTTVPHFTPIDRVDEVSANKQPVLWETLTTLPEIHVNRIDPLELAEMPIAHIKEKILAAHDAQRR